MARLVSADSKPLPPVQLVVRRPALDRHWGALTVALGGALQLDRQQLQVDPDYRNEGVWAGLVGTACERVMRNQGGLTPVAPLHAFQRGVMAWIGLQEVWDVLSGTQQFAFRQLGLTVHLGYPGDPIKPQVFRSEWAGIKDWAGTGVDFQARGAGHPHWQIDVLETLRELPPPAEFGVDPADVVEDFAVETSDTNVLLRSITLERVHFASAAAWWASASASGLPHHMNAPESELGLAQWVVGCVRYLKQELARCEVR